MNEESSVLTADPVAASSAPKPARPFSWQRFGGKFLVISVLAHVLFLAVAGVFIVQRYIAPSKRNFLPSSRPNAATRSFEHKVQMKKQKTAMSAPPSAKRVTTTGLSKVSLPAMPAMPSMSSSLAPAGMSGMGAGGVAPGALGGGSLGGMGGGGKGVNFFGVSGGGGLTGTFYDLKQTSGKQPTGMTPQKYAQEVTAFLRSNWNPTFFAKYFRGPQTINAMQILVPNMPATEGPTAFNLQNDVKPSMWVVHYKGNVSPTESGIYHFVGAGDDVMMVRFDNRLVLAKNWNMERWGIVQTNWTPPADYDYGYPAKVSQGFAKGNAIEVQAGKSYPMEVLIGEQPGGAVFASLLIEKEGVSYQKNAKGHPIVPVFRLTSAPLPPLKPGMTYPPHAEGGPVWRAAAPAKTSVFDR